MSKPIINTEFVSGEPLKGVNEKLAEEHSGEFKVTGSALLIILRQRYMGFMGVSLYICSINMNVYVCVYIYVGKGGTDKR